MSLCEAQTWLSLVSDFHLMNESIMTAIIIW